MQELLSPRECLTTPISRVPIRFPSCVVFKNAKPSKGDYRHYHVKTVEGPNDFRQHGGSGLPPPSDS